MRERQKQGVAVDTRLRTHRRQQVKRSRAARIRGHTSTNETAFARSGVIAIGEVAAGIGSEIELESTRNGADVPTSLSFSVTFSSFPCDRILVERKRVSQKCAIQKTARYKEKDVFV